MVHVHIQTAFFNAFVLLSVDSTSSTSATSSTGTSSGFPASGGSVAANTSAGGLGANTGSGPARYRDKNGRGESSLHVAAIKGDYDQVKKLLDQGIHPNVTDNAGGWSTHAHSL